MICVTSAIQSSDYPKRFPVTDSSTVGRFVETLNRMKSVPAGADFNCPVNHGPHLEGLLFFNYPTGNVLVVQVDSCPLATNGSRAALGPGPIWRLIDQAQQDASA